MMTRIRTGNGLLLICTLALTASLIPGCKKSKKVETRQEQSNKKQPNEQATPDETTREEAATPKTDEPVAKPETEPSPDEKVEAAAKVGNELIPRSFLLQRHAERTGETDSITHDRLLRTLELLVAETRAAIEAKAHGLEVSPEEVEAYIEKQVKKHGSEEAFKSHLSKTGRKMDLYKKKVQITLLRTKLRNKMFPFTVTDEAVREYYHKKYAPQRKQKGLRVKVATITLNMPKTVADPIRKELETQLMAYKEQVEAGTPFAELAREHSQDAYAKRGGERVWISKSSRPTELFNAVKSEEIGALMGPIVSSKGLHLAKVLGRKDPNVGNYEKEKDTVRAILENVKRTQAEAKLKRYLDKIPVRTFL